MGVSITLNCKKRICIVTEDIAEPIDEGFKKTIFEICGSLGRSRKTLVLGRNISSRLGSSILCNRFYASAQIFKRIREFAPEALIYLPLSSLTLGSFLRARILSIFAAVPLTMVGFQPRSHSCLARLIIGLLKPSLVLVQSRKSLEFCRALGLNSDLLPSGVDLARFAPVDPAQKRLLRESYGLPLDRKILLHVGHLRKGRKLEDLTHFAGDEFLPLVVTSSSTSRDEVLKKGLQDAGVHFYSKFVERIEHFYQMADAYVFPTQNSTSAIEFPLSILEAMGCGLPVLTTRFGGVCDFFSEDETVKFYDGIDDGKEKLRQLLANPAAGSSNTNMAAFSWDSVAGRILEKVDKL